MIKPPDPAPIIADLLSSALMPPGGTWESARAPYVWERAGLSYREARKLAGDRPPINAWTAMLVDEGYPAANHGTNEGTPNPLRGRFWKPGTPAPEGYAEP